MSVFFKEKKANVLNVLHLS